MQKIPTATSSTNMQPSNLKLFEISAENKK